MDVLVIDRMLPKRRRAWSLIGTLREKGNRTPALILSALGQVDDRIKGLRAGGDGLPAENPIHFAEPAGTGSKCCRARPWRPRPRKPPIVSATSSSIVFSHRVARGKDELTLQPREFPAAGISHEARRAGGDADHAAGKRLGLSFRSADPMSSTCIFRGCAPRSTRVFERAVASYDSRRGIHDP